MRQGALWRVRTPLLVAAPAMVVALLLAATADATRYASPTGSGSCATPAEACDLRTAVEGKGKNEPEPSDRVIVASGTYTIGATIETGAGNMHIEGEPGQPRPILKGNAGQLIRIANGGVLAYLAVEEEGTAEGVFADNATLERLWVTGKPSGQMLCQCYDGLIRDSIFIARPGSNNGGAVGVNSNGGTAHETLRNDTIISESKEARAIWLAEQLASGKLTMNVVNTIAVNTAGGHDVDASEFSAITLEHSDYASPLADGEITDTGGHITAAPLFVNAEAGDFRELAGSPTIDGGLTEAENGELDYEGGPRTVAAATDIGAFEYQPPAPGVSAPVTDPGSSPVPATPKTVPLAPVITRTRLSAPVFRAAAKGSAFAASRRPSVGAKLTWLDSEQASTTLRVARVATGHRTSHGCAAGKPSGHQHPCRRSVPVVSFPHSDVAGANVLRLTGRVRNRKLQPGSYALTLSPVAGGLTGLPVTLRFRIA